MLFSYHNEDNLIPVKITRVKEIKTLINEGMILKDLMEEAEAIIEEPVIDKVLDYVNAVGQDSISRFDKKRKPKHKHKKRHR